ncbi:MAG: hypothetical protein JWQ98_2572 [Chlorobi bacterium]|nr:hypothetical protein [Chlorobiota bacterium]
MIRHCFAFILMATFAGIAELQAQTIATPSGPLEFIGLRSWNPQQLWNAIYASSPGSGAHACAAVLKSDFEFPDAAVNAYMENDSIYWVVTVVEKEFRDRVQYLPAQTGSVAIPSDWNPLLTIPQSKALSINIAVQTYHHILAEKQADAVNEVVAETKSIREHNSSITIDMALVKSLWKFLGDHRTGQDRTLAMRVLATDSSEARRTLAASMLLNFADNDSTWHILVDAERDSSSNVREAARTSLGNLVDDKPRTIHWMPAVPALRHILAGTNLFALTPTLVMLTKTGISPTLASPLLHGNADLVLGYLQAHHQFEREVAHDFLAAISGRDYGFDAAKWGEWIAGL